MQILTECLLKWDTKRQTSKGKEILGTVLAFAGAGEEQGRKTQHQHWQIWVEEINQTLRDCLFHNTTTRNKAQNTFCKHIDNVLSASYGPDLCITHRCIYENQNEKLKTDIANNLFKEKEPCYFCHVRHKDLCNKVKGGIMYCGECDKNITTVDIVNQSLQRLREAIIPGNRAQLNRPDTNIPLSPERLDMAA